MFFLVKNSHKVRFVEIQRAFMICSALLGCTLGGLLYSISFIGFSEPYREFVFEKSANRSEFPKICVLRRASKHSGLLMLLNPIGAAYFIRILFFLLLFISVMMF